MATNDYGLWSDRLNTFTKYNTNVSAVDKANSGIDIKATGNTQVLRRFGDENRENLKSETTSTPTPGTPVKFPNGFQRGYKYTPTTPAEGQDFWSATGDILSIPLRLGTSLLLTLGVGAQAVRHLVNAGPEFSWDNQNDWLGKQLQNAWTDPWETSMIFNNKGFLEEKKKPHADLGTALTYGLGQTTSLLGDMAVASNPVNTVYGLVTGSKFTISGKWDRQLQNQEAIQTFSWMSKNWGVSFAELQFDPFSSSQRATVTGAEYNPDGTLKLDESGRPITGSGWTAGNVATQFFGNFIGGLALDPISYIPMSWLGKVGKVLFGGRLLTGTTKKTVAKNIATDMEQWAGLGGLADSGLNASGRYASKEAAEAAAGQKLDYWDFAKFAADNNADTISQHVVIKSITSGEKENIAWLLGQATSEQEVAKIFLATEYGSQRAFQELVSSRPNLKLALDEFADGGYLVRGERDGSLSTIAMLDSLDHPEFLKAVVESTDLLAKDEFSSVLSNLIAKAGPEGIGGNTVLRELMPSKYGLINKFEGGKARVGTFFVHGKTHDGSVRVERRFGNGTNFWYHQVVRPFQTSAKGMIDLEDPVGDASRKFFGMLGDIDRLSGSALSNGGYRAALSNAWRTAITPDAKAKVIQNAQELGLTLIATKQGFNKETAAALTTILSEKKRIFTENLQRNGVVVMKYGNEKIIYNDPFMVNQTPNKINLWDFSKVRDELIKAKPQIIADAPVLYNLAKAGVMFKGGVSSFYNSIGALFQSIVLFRAGRTGRDMFQNGVSSLLSGYGGAMLKNAINPALLLNAVENNASRALALETRMALSLRGYARPEKIEKTIKSLDDLNIAILEQEAIRLRKIVQDVANKKIEDIPYEDIPRFLASAHELSASRHYHVSMDRQAFLDEHMQVPEGQRPIAVFDNQDDALDYINKLGVDIKKSKATDTLTLADTVGKRITKDTRTKVETALANGDIVHVRLAGRGRNWQLLDPKKFRSQTDADIAKYEIRVVDSKLAGGTTKQELLDAVDRGDIVYASRAGEKFKPLTRTEIEAITDVSTVSGKIFPKGKMPGIVPIRAYGRTVELSSFKDLPEEFLKVIKVKNQKELDAWIAAKGYDNLTFLDHWTMNKYDIGKFTVAQDGKVISILNPIRSDVTEKEVNRALLVSVIKDLEDAGVDWTGMGFLAGQAALRDKLVAAGWTTGKQGAKPISPDELAKMVIGQLTDAGEFSRSLVKRLGKNAEAKLKELETSTLPINAKLANLYGVGDDELLPAINAVKQTLVNNVEQMETLNVSLIKSRAEWDKLNAIKANRKNFETDGTIRIGQEDFAQSLAGIEGDIFLGKLAKSVEDVRLRDSLWKPMDAELVTRVVKPNEIGYWDAWANVLNRNFMHDGKLDPVVRIVIEARFKGITDEDDVAVLIKDWLKTAEGTKYADAVGVGKKYSVVGPGTEQFIRPDKVRFEQLSEEDFAIMNIRNVDNHLGEITPEMKPMTLEEAEAFLAKQTEGLFSGSLSAEQMVEYSNAYPNLIAKKLLAGEEVTPLELQAYHLGRNPKGDEIGQPVKEEAGQVLYGQTQEGLPDIWASIADPSQRTLTQRLGREALNKWNRAITDYPQQVFFQMPMFHVAYKESLERQMIQKATAKGIGVDDVRITEAERLNIVRKARQYALNETRKWIYSYTDGMEIRQALAAVVPFGNAFLFSMKSLVNGARYNPASAALMIYWANKLNQNTHWVDKNGNPVGFDERDENGERKAAFVQASLPEWFTNSLAGGEVKQILFNRQSLDPVFQGNYQDVGLLPFAIPNPLQSFSLMPIPTIALSELVKSEAKQGGEGPATTFTEWANRVLPFGPSSEQWSWDLLMPGNTAKQLWSAPNWWNQEGSGIWTRSYLNSVQYVNGQYLLGKYPEIDALPTQEQRDKALLGKAKEYTGAIFWLKAFSDFVSPVATTYITPGDIARKAYKSNKDKAQAEFDSYGTTYEERLKVWEDKYGRGYTVNDMALYNTMYENEEWWAASISPTFNQYGIEYNTDSLTRLERNKGLIKSVQDYGTAVGMNDNDIRDVLSWVVNDGRRNPGAAFDENSYAALQSDYLNPRTPGQYNTYIKIQKGWYHYNNGYTSPTTKEKLPGLKWLENNLMIPTAKPSDTAEIKPFYYEGRYISGTYGYWKSKLTNALYDDPRFGAVWQSDKKKSIDPNKFNDLAGVWTSIIWNGYGSDGKPLPGTNKVETQLDKDIATFLIARYNRQKQLRERGQLTGRGTLAQNPDIEAGWENDLEPLLNGSNPDFEDWYYNFRWNEDSLN